MAKLNDPLESIIADVRTKAESYTDKMVGALRGMLGDLPKRMKELPTTVPFYTVC